MPVYFYVNGFNTEVERLEVIREGRCYVTCKSGRRVARVSQYGRVFRTEREALEFLLHRERDRSKLLQNRADDAARGAAELCNKLLHLPVNE